MCAPTTLYGGYGGDDCGGCAGGYVRAEADSESAGAVPRRTSVRNSASSENTVYTTWTRSSSMKVSALRRNDLRAGGGAAQRVESDTAAHAIIVWRRVARDE